MNDNECQGKNCELRIKAIAEPSVDLPALRGIINRSSRIIRYPVSL